MVILVILKFCWMILTNVSPEFFYLIYFFIFYVSSPSIFGQHCIICSMELNKSHKIIFKILMMLSFTGFIFLLANR